MKRVEQCLCVSVQLFLLVVYGFKQPPSLQHTCAIARLVDLKTLSQSSKKEKIFLNLLIY